jgi:hypothetical protein
MKSAFLLLSATALGMGMATPFLAATPPNPTAPKPNNPNPPLQLVPQLTPETLKNFHRSYGLVIGGNLTPNQKSQIDRRLKKDWLLNLGLRSGVLQTIAIEPQLTKAKQPQDRDALVARLIDGFRQRVLDGDLDTLWLLSYYDGRASNLLARGNPSLTRMTTDIGTDALCFMVNEVMGKPVVTPSFNLKTAIAYKLTTEYPSLSYNRKQELSRLTMDWLRFKQTEWVRRGEDFREEMRIYWGQTLEAHIPELKPMVKLRKERMARLKADPKTAWDAMSPDKRIAALVQSQPSFQQVSTRTLTTVKTIPLLNYTYTMPLTPTVVSAPTKYPLRLNIK